MKLRNAARHFDRTRVEDAFDSDVFFKAQMDLFQDVVRDGTTAERRVLSTDPSIVLPEKKVLRIDGDCWVVGQMQKDHYNNTPIRHKYVLALAHAFTALKTFSEAIGEEAGQPLYVSMEWVKTIKEPNESSTELGSYSLHFASVETVGEGKLIQIGSRWFVIRSVFPSLSGYISALSDELPNPVLQTAEFNSRLYNATTDSYTASVTEIQILKMRWQSHFRYPTQASEKFQPGDDVVIIRKEDLTPKANHTFTVAGVTYAVVTVLDEGDCWSCHARQT